MPIYLFRCEKCKINSEQVHLMSEAHEPCQKCGEPYGDVFHQRFMEYQTQAIQKGDPKTFGQQSELNAKRLGKEQMQLMEEDIMKPKPFTGKLPAGASLPDRSGAAKPFWRENKKKPINPKKINVKKYVEEGKQ